MPSKFLQLHFLTAYPSALLNRDDAGFAKRIPFGGVTRTRISSQCLKRHWRTHEGEWALSRLEAPRSVRSRLTFDRLVVEPLVADGVDESQAIAATETLMKEVLGQSDKASKTKKGDEDSEGEKGAARTAVHTGQITVLGRPELDHLRDLARRACDGASDAKAAAKAAKELIKEEKKNLKALKLAAGLDAALFGRMVTSDNLARGDASIHVAHAFTVHGEESEADYFSAVDDLSGTGDEATLGAGHINSSELTSGLYYGYVVVDLPLLVSNLTGCTREDWVSADKTLARGVVEHLVHLVATVSPGAKLGSTAPYAYASLVLAELGDAQPRTLANAFLGPVASRPDLLENTYQALARHIAQLDQMYGSEGRRQLVGLGDTAGLLDATKAEKADSLATLAGWVASDLEAGDA